MFYIIVITLFTFFIFPVSHTFAVDPICQADTVAKMQLCVDQFNQNQIDTIQITNQIICDSSSDCDFNITRKQSGQIYGVPGSNAGFTRKKFNGNVFRLINAENISIGNIVIDDDKSIAGCQWIKGGMIGNCGPQISIHDSKNITLKQLVMTNSKVQAVLIIGKSQDITFRLNQVDNTFEQGMMITSNGPRDIIFEGNAFKNTGGTAIYMQGTDITVRYNSIYNAQWAPPWDIGGGGINIHGVVHANIRGNYIYHGIGTSPPFNGGIEFSKDSTNINIVQNVIHDHSGPAIYNDRPALSPTSKVIINNNQLTKVGKDYTSDPINDRSKGNAKWTLSNNCFTTPCTNRLPVGVLSITPNQCLILPNETSCQVSASWHTNFATNVSASNGTTTYGTGGSKKEVIITVGTEPQTINLVGSNKVLDSQTVVGTYVTTPAKPGDYNSDGSVNAADYDTLLAGYGTTYTIQDYNRLVRNQGL